MGKKLFGVALLVVLVIFATTATSFHKYSLVAAESQAITSQWNEAYWDTHGVDVLTQFAPLPERDRSLVLYQCKPVYASFHKLRGSKDVLPSSLAPGCQALIKGGWHPNWQVSDGVRFIRNPEQYTWP